jgi:hypothetical protein
MHKNATKCNKTQRKWCVNKHGASKIIDTFETYQYATARRKRNLIKRLKVEDNWVEGTGALKPHILDYFSNLFSSEVQDIDPALLEKTQPRVSEYMNEKLLAPFSPEDVKKAAFSIAPRPDGLHAIFYKQFWAICEEDIMREVIQAMNAGIIPEVWNDTTVVLIPKTDSPESIS